MKWVAVACGTIVSLASIAGNGAPASLAGLMACRNLVDTSARLSCYDRETSALARVPTSSAGTSVSAGVGAVAGSGSSSSPPPNQPSLAAPPPAHAAPALSPEQQFGMPERKVAAQEVAAGTRAADATKIEARLTRVSVSADGRTVFALDNDQVWRQLVAEGELLAKVGERVTISRGLLGSYWLQLSTGRGCKVARLH